MSSVPFPRANQRVMADDGSDLQFCTTCAFSHACLSQGMDKAALMDLHVLVEHVGPYHAGDTLFREGDAFEAIAAVRDGTVKTCVTDRDGHEPVLGFHFPEEGIGPNAGDGHRLFEAHIFPSLTGVHGFINTVAPRRALAVI